MTNYFGLVLSFMVPGIVIGLLAAGAAREIEENRRTKIVRTSPRRSLYIEDLRKEEMRSGQKKKLTEAAASKPAGENAFVFYHAD